MLLKNLEEKMKIIKYIKLGTCFEYLLLVISLGQSKKIAHYVANKLGFEDCGCSKRKDYLNNLFLRKEEKTITLN
jgi:hypothetical protein